MKALKSSKSATGPADPAAQQVEAARRAQDAIKLNSESPEHYTALASALRALAGITRERYPEAADNLLRLACAAAWEAKRRSTPALISGRTRQEVKTLTAWLRMKNHASPEAAEGQMEEIRAERLAEAVETSDFTHLATRIEH
jgi:hypothetical protein